MRIIYIGKHGNARKSNDDEGAIAHAFEQLGHEVHCVQEGSPLPAMTGRKNFILFHHWPDPSPIETVRGVRAFWCFDRIEEPDLSLEVRNSRRKEWAKRITQIVDIGFMTDGDWVARDRSGRLVHLMQGCDGTTMGCPPRSTYVHPVLFTGISRGGGAKRESLVQELSERYGPRFTHIQRGMHGRGLAQTLADSAVVIGPDSPVSDRYWSNRVYLTLGYGGFLLHPYCKQLAEQYVEGHELVMYDSRAELYRLIDYYLDPGNAEERERIRAAGHAKTHACHTYRHRCERLLQIVEERFGLK